MPFCIDRAAPISHAHRLQRLRGADGLGRDDQGLRASQQPGIGHDGDRQGQVDQPFDAQPVCADLRGATSTASSTTS